MYKYRRVKMPVTWGVQLPLKERLHRNRPFDRIEVQKFRQIKIEGRSMPASVDARGEERREIEIYARVKHYKSLL